MMSIAPFARLVSGLARQSSRRRSMNRAPLVESMEQRNLLTYMMVGSLSAVEGTGSNRTANFVVSLNAASTQTITVDYGTVAGTAASGSDFSPVSGKLTFTPGQTRLTVPVPIMADSQLEPTENFRLSLRNAINATLLTSSGTCSIVDDDAVLTPELSISDPRVTEGNSGTKQMLFTVSLNTPVLDRSVSVSVKTLEGSAKAGSDFVAASQVITFKPGETSKSFAVNIVGDGTYEYQEGFYATLSNGGVAIKKATGVGIILNDDPTA